MASPWLSPHVVNRSARPNVFTDIGATSNVPGMRHSRPPEQVRYRRRAAGTASSYAAWIITRPFSTFAGYVFRSTHAGAPFASPVR